MNVDTRDQLDAAICRQTDPDLWFPDKGGDHNQAKRLCRACPLVEPCLQYSLDHDEQWGVWGGATRRERRKMIKARAALDGAEDVSG